MSKTFQSDTPCPRCGNRERYVKKARGYPLGRCVTCARRTNAEAIKKPDRKLSRSFYHAKRRAERLGLPFTIRLEDLKMPEFCPVLGIPMDVPSLDRHKPHLGYTPSNTKVISWRANSLKSDATLEEIKLLAAYMENTV